MVGLALKWEGKGKPSSEHPGGIHESVSSLSSCVWGPSFHSALISGSNRQSQNLLMGLLHSSNLGMDNGKFH